MEYDVSAHSEYSERIPVFEQRPTSANTTSGTPGRDSLRQHCGSQDNQLT